MSDREKATHAVILLAAGGSARMGTPKQLLAFRGRPLLRHAAETALASGCDATIVVLGARAEALRPALAGLPLDIVVNEGWADGMGGSIQAGVRAAMHRGWSTVTLTLADQPFVTADILGRLVALHRELRTPIVASRYSGTVGVPALFAREAFPLLMALGPDQGCKGVILGHQSLATLIDCPEAAIDIDTPQDYAAMSGTKT